MEIKVECNKVRNLFQKNKYSFFERRTNVKKLTFSLINWSDTYLDFTSYESIVNQTKSANIYKTENKKALIKNYFIENCLIYSVHTENENWGSVFIDYAKGVRKWFLFSENADDEVVLQQMRVVYTENKKIIKECFYMLDEDLDEETFMLYSFDYDEQGKIKVITRVGFYENEDNILPKQIYSFTYKNGIEQINIKQEK